MEFLVWARAIGRGPGVFMSFGEKLRSEIQKSGKEVASKAFHPLGPLGTSVVLESVKALFGALPTHSARCTAESVRLA